MKSITLVCRSWYKVGTGFLYQHICIRRFPQLKCLRDTLYTSHSSRNLGVLVKSLDIQCHIPEKLATEFARNLCAIMKLCPFVTTFGYTSPCTLPPSALPTSCLKSQVTHLQLHHTVRYIDLVSILRDLQDQLLVLDVGISSTTHSGEPLNSFGTPSPDPKTRLIFPSLLTLSFSSEPHVLDILKADWSMPSLQRFTFSVNHHSQDAIIDFLSTHGRRLLYLRMGIWFHDGLPFSKVLELCPLLEHLVMHPATFKRIYGIPKNEVLHPKLRFLDLTYPFSQRFEYADSKLWISEKVLPSLELVRHLCNIPSYLNAWVDRFEPCSDTESNDFTIWLFQHQVIYKYGVLLYNFKRNKTKNAMEFYQEPEMSWRFSAWEDVGDEYYQEPDLFWRFSNWDGELFNPETSSDESSEDDEWIFDSGDDRSALFS